MSLVSTITVADPLADPAILSPIQWGTRLASFKSRMVDESDPRVVECRAALAYWRCRRALDAEHGHISPAHLDALIGHLREAVIA